jgi:hypothetical protein
MKKGVKIRKNRILKYCFSSELTTPDNLLTSRVLNLVLLLEGLFCSRKAKFVALSRAEGKKLEILVSKRTGLRGVMIC